jgi:uncharacterized protein (TIGR02145 family)
MKIATVLFLTFVTFSGFGNSQSIKIGTLTWTAKNLDVTTFRNGDPIPQAKSDAEWVAAGENYQPAWCYYDNDPKNGTKYGKLYNWFAVNDARGLAPSGWHIPTDEEWTKMTVYLGSQLQFGDYRDQSKPLFSGKNMKSKKGWSQRGNGTNKSGFSGLPGGARDRDGSFLLIGYSGVWWTASESENTNPWFYYLVSTDDYIVNFNGAEKGKGFSVRCVKD